MKPEKMSSVADMKKLWATGMQFGEDLYVVASPSKSSLKRMFDRVRMDVDENSFQQIKIAETRFSP